MPSWRKAALRIGERDVLASGSVIAPGDMPVFIQVAGAEVALRFCEVAGAERRTQRSQHGDSLTIELINFGSAVTALETIVGDVEGHPVTMALFVQTLPSNVRTLRLLNYTFTVNAEPSHPRPPSPEAGD